MTGGKPKSVRYMTTVTTHAGMTAVVYYETTIVKFTAAEIVLNTGDWWTRTTRERMNWTSQEFKLGYQIIEHGKTWYVEYQGVRHPFRAQKVRLDRKTGAVIPV